MTKPIASQKDKPEKFEMVIQGGMLDALGINMYSTLAKSMVEFVANAYDGEASYVNISIPFERILAARAAVRAEAKMAVDEGRIEPFSVLLLPLPDDIEIVISDDGHGMDPSDVQQKFLPVNRKRRLDDATGKENKLNSETGKRQVMGRKGLGKLAGFGVAEQVTIKTKRAEDDFWTIFEMDYSSLSKADNLGGVPIPAKYELGEVGKKGTIIILSRLRCDALKRGENDLRSTLHQNFFGVRPEDFAIKINETAMPPPTVQYFFTYPEERPHNGFARTTVEVPDVASIEFDYVVKFRRPGDSLKNDQRGARVYCHHRLSAGPSLFGLPSGVHNFHGQDYMECIVQANKLDEIGVDLVSTDRTQLKGESEVVVAFVDRITEILRLALNAHYKFKEGIVDQEIEEKNPEWIKRVNRLDKRTQEPVRKLLHTLGSQFGVGSAEFNEIAPLVMNTMKSGEVLVRLIEVGSRVSDIRDVANALIDLAEVEKSQALTVFRGRLSGIHGLRELVRRGEEEWRKKQFEEELHALLKRCPWLIRQEFSNHLTSNESLQTTCSELAKYLEVDHFAKDNLKNPDLRPDLVFLMSDPQAHEIVIVELKSPSIPLEDAHLQQLIGYMADIDGWLKRKFNSGIKITGYLIGTRETPEKRTQGASRLEYQIETQGAGANWKVYDLRQLLRDTESAHADIIAAIEKELGEDHILMVPKTTGTAASAITASPATQEPKAADPLNGGAIV